MNKPIIFNPGIRLSEHFRLGEFTKSITAERLRRRLRERYILKQQEAEKYS